jgi:hypothetical protein
MDADGRPHKIRCHVLHRDDWSVTFTEADCCTSIGPWLLCDSAEDVEKILNWGRATLDDLTEHRRNIRRWGVGGAMLHLTSRERHQLIVRGQGWPWNGDELRQMKAAGKYPPQRLTLEQETAYFRSRAAKVT